MNEQSEELLEVLKIMKDLHGNGFHLTKEINAVIKSLLQNSGITYAMLNEKKQLNN